MDPVKQKTQNNIVFFLHTTFYGVQEDKKKRMRRQKCRKNKIWSAFLSISSQKSGLRGMNGYLDRGFESGGGGGGGGEGKG
jgi:hypothetical protein